MTWTMRTKNTAFNQDHTIKDGLADILEVKMDFNFLIMDHEKPEDALSQMIAKTDGTIQQSLIINCHGKPGEFSLGSGVGIGNCAIFSKIRHQFNDIWIAACNVASGSDGSKLCHEIAKHSQAVVLASPFLVGQKSDLPKYEIVAWQTPVHMYVPGEKKHRVWDSGSKPDVPVGPWY